MDTKDQTTAVSGRAADDELIEHLAKDIAEGDQSWRETVKARYAEYLMARAGRLEEQAADDEAKAKLPGYEGLSGVNEQNRATAAELYRQAEHLLDEGSTLEDPEEAELILRMLAARELQPDAADPLTVAEVPATTHSIPQSEPSENVATSRDDVGDQQTAPERDSVQVDLLGDAANAQAFLNQIGGLLAKHEERVSDLVHQLVAEKLKPLLDEFQEIREAAAALVAPAEHTVETGITVVGDSVAKLIQEVSDRVTFVEKRIRHTV